jgi:hypothetical protein
LGFNWGFGGLLHLVVLDKEIRFCSSPTDCVMRGGRLRWAGDIKLAFEPRLIGVLLVLGRISQFANIFFITYYILLPIEIGVLDLLKFRCMVTLFSI